MTHRNHITLIVCVLLMHASMASAQTQAAATESAIATSEVIRDTGQGQFPFPAADLHELSGITHLGGSQFAVVPDKGGKLGLVTIDVDATTGKITSAVVTKTLTLQAGKDVEDIAYDPTTCLLLRVDESDQTVSRHHLPSGDRIETVNAPAVFKQARPNLGFESLAISPDTGRVWTANEEPLKQDGPRPTQDAGSLIRLQRFDHDLKPDGQFAYRVDPHRGSDNLIGRAQSGVSGMVALPNGQLIIMERELGGPVIPSFRIRLYLVDTIGATDTSKLDTLLEQDVRPVAKTLLYEFNAGLANFEGITIGPKLNNGDYTLLLVSDDGGGKRNPQNLLSLRLAGDLMKRSQER